MKQTDGIKTVLCRIEEKRIAPEPSAPATSTTTAKDASDQRRGDFRRRGLWFSVHGSGSKRLEMPFKVFRVECQIEQGQPESQDQTRRRKDQSGDGEAAAFVKLGLPADLR